MGWAVGDHNGRDVGYGVPAKCDHPDCHNEIDRGLDYVCGTMHGGENGCGLYFCPSHVFRGTGPVGQQCERCINDEEPFEPKPDVQRWIQHKLTDPTWQRWRDEHPQWVADLT